MPVRIMDMAMIDPTGGSSLNRKNASMEAKRGSTRISVDSRVGDTYFTAKFIDPWPRICGPKASPAPAAKPTAEIFRRSSPNASARLTQVIAVKK